MARRTRLYLPGCAQHIIQRGNNRDACFYSDEDYRCYLHCLKETAKKYQVSIHAFVLMTNHVHLLATPSSELSMSRMMQALGRKYVQYFNYSYERAGTLWEGRYKSTIVDSTHYLLTVYRYIELNPIRAKMVVHAAEYPWSSYQHNAVGKRIELITDHEEYLKLGKESDERRAVYRALFNERMCELDIQQIRDTTNKAWVLGGEQFKARCNRPAKPVGRGGDRRSKSYVDRAI